MVFSRFPAAFAWVSLWGLFPLLNTAISWIRASEPSDFSLTACAFVAWLGLFAAKDWRRAVRTLLRAIAPTFIIVFAFVYSGAAVIWISSAIALAWVVGYLLFDRRELARISLGLVVPGIIVGVWYLATLSEGAVIPLDSRKCSMWSFTVSRASHS
ncbi:MAG: hypothetical protein U5N86_03490 [Planctomycetota bacterium]|nr:hypothetical protein [Planctomycetota bacterium]